MWAQRGEGAARATIWLLQCDMSCRVLLLPPLLLSGNSGGSGVEALLRCRFVSCCVSAAVCRLSALPAASCDSCPAPLSSQRFDCSLQLPSLSLSGKNTKQLSSKQNNVSSTR